MTVVGYAGGLAIKKCTSASALSPQLLLVRRESGCTGVYRSDSLDKLMQEECVHFRVGAVKRSDPEKNPKRYPEQKRGKEPLTEESRNYRSLV